MSEIETKVNAATRAFAQLVAELSVKVATLEGELAWMATERDRLREELASGKEKAPD